MKANTFSSTEERLLQDETMQIAEHLFEQFCALPPSMPAIPPIIHMIWLGSPPPPAVRLVMASWIKHHPTWEVKLWTDEEVQDLQWSHPKSAFLFAEAKNWAEKSDILRFEILHQYGGIYTDTDAVCLKPLNPLLESGLSFFACFEDNKVNQSKLPLVGSAVVLAAKNHPILHRCLEYSSSEREAPGIQQYLRSGPGPLSRACYEALEAGDQDLVILPRSYFYPLPWMKRYGDLKEVLKSIRPESFTVHLWEGTWFGKEEKKL